MIWIFDDFFIYFFIYFTINNIQLYESCTLDGLLEMEKRFCSSTSICNFIVFNICSYVQYIYLLIVTIVMQTNIVFLRGRANGAVGK